MNDVQIVNGLQTSHALYKSFNNMIKENKNKLISIKIIEIGQQDITVTEKIIKATNFQTPISIPSFRAAEPLQKDIEDFLKTKNLYYDRRKNYYKNQGKNASEIVTIQAMAQAVNALALKDPRLSRNSPAGLTKKDEKYHEIFSTKELSLYSNCILFIKKVNSMISEIKNNDYKNNEKKNLSFHIALRALQLTLNKVDFSIKDIINLDLSQLNVNIVEQAMHEVITKAREQESKTGETLLNVAKSVSFSEVLRQYFEGNKNN
jgi:hypothetical protein